MLLSAVTALFWAVTPAVASLTAQHYHGIPSVGVLYTQDPRKHFCSATVVKSKPGNIILTAAHCIRGDGKHLRFAPGYHDGSTPYGTYPVTGVFVHPEWNKSFDVTRDFAFITLGNATISGRSVTVQQITGGNKIIFNASSKHVVKVFGYNMNEERPIRCTTSTYEVKGRHMGFNCDAFKAGTSGAPWVTKYNHKTMLGNIVGLIAGLESGGCSDNTSYSPRFRSEIKTVLEEATNSTGKAASSWVVRGGVPKYC